MKKILLLIPIISDYRVPIYNIISKHYDLTIGYNIKDDSKQECHFKKTQLKRKIIKNLYINNLSFFSFCRNYDIILFVSDLHHLSFCLLPFLGKLYKTISWSIGIRASYKRKYNLYRKKELLDYCYYFLLRACNANVFYMKEPISFWKRFHLDDRNIFIAHNTVKINYKEEENKQLKEHLLFIGTLYKEKGIDVLLNEYLKAYAKNNNQLIPLNIIGDGPCKKDILKFIKENGLEKNIVVHGAIYDENILKDFFYKAIACISPHQAGLSVLKSLGYGVPFITQKDAITGGEIFNIKHEENGILYEKDHELSDIMIRMTNNKEEFLEMGRNARDFYLKNATPEIMANGILEAIDYTFSHK